MSNAVTNLCRPLRLTAARKCVLMALADRAAEDGSCWPSVAWLVEWTCFSKTPVLNALKWLSDAGVITIEKSAGRSNRCQIELENVKKLTAEHAEPAPEASTPGAPTGTPGTPVLLEHQYSKSTTTSTPGAPTGTPEAPDTSIDTNKTEEEERDARASEKPPPDEQPDLLGMASPQVVELPLKGQKRHTVTEADVDSWRPAFPQRDIPLELQRMRVWLMADPTRLKTAGGINRFIVGWLGRELDSAPTANPAASSRRLPRGGRPIAHLGTDQRNYEEDFDGQPIC